MKKFLNLIFLFGLYAGISLAASVGDIDVSFCGLEEGNTKSLAFAIESGSPYEFCLEFINNSNDPAFLDLDFVDVEETNDAYRNKACSTNGGIFGQMVELIVKKMSIGGGESVQITGLITAPTSFSGRFEGCLVYSVLEEKNKLSTENSLFDVVVRKAKFIDGYAVGEFDRKGPEYLWANYVYDKQNDRLLVSVTFQNDGNIPELLLYTGYIKSPLGYTKILSSSAIIEAKNQTFVNLYFENIPFYKGLYNFGIEGTSILNPDLDLSYVPDDIKQDLKFSHKKVLFVMPWNIVLYLFGIFLVLRLIKMIVMLFWKR